MGAVGRSAAIAAVLFLVAGPVAHAQGGRLSADAGLDLVSGRYASGSGNSYSLRVKLATLGSISMNAGFGWAEGSGSYSPFNCHLARRFYCFGGSESLTAADFGVHAEGRPLNHFLGFALVPVASIGVTRSRSRVSELEGPTALCLENGEVVSCSDNPPFQTFASDESVTAPSLSYGVVLTRTAGAVAVRLGLTDHHAGFGSDAHQRLRFSVGLGF